MRLWKGDLGSSVEIPLKAIRGGEGRSLGGRDGGVGELLSIEYGTAGQDAPSGGGLHIKLSDLRF